MEEGEREDILGVVHTLFFFFLCLANCNIILYNVLIVGTNTVIRRFLVALELVQHTAWRPGYFRFTIPPPYNP